mgnify:CR=1 FL=1
MNFDYITYSTPNTAARELIEDPAIRNSKIAFPDASELERCETFQFLGDKTMPFIISFGAKSNPNSFF